MANIMARLCAYENQYVSINGFIGRKCDEANCRQINTMVIDVDAHDSIDFANNLLERIKETAYAKICDAADKNIMPEPTMVIDSGRGLHVLCMQKALQFQEINYFNHAQNNSG